MTSSPVARLRVLAANATPGPWTHLDDSPLWHRVGAEAALDHHVTAASLDDAEFVAAARNHWDALLDCAEALEEIAHVATDLPHARRLDSEQMREIARAALSRLARGTEQ